MPLASWAAFGTLTVRTPFFISAKVLLSSTSISRVIVRESEPKERGASVLSRASTLLVHFEKAVADEGMLC